MLPAASSVVRSTALLMKTKLLPQKTATLKSSTSATSALRREACVLPVGVAIAAILSDGRRAGGHASYSPAGAETAAIETSGCRRNPPLPNASQVAPPSDVARTGWLVVVA